MSTTPNYSSDQGNPNYNMATPVKIISGGGGTPGSGIAPYVGTPLGYGQASVTNGAAVAISTVVTEKPDGSGTQTGIPAGATTVLVTPEGSDMRWRDDTVAPTTSVGNVTYATGTLTYSATQMANLKFIGVQGTATVNFYFFK